MFFVQFYVPNFSIILYKPINKLTLLVIVFITIGTILIQDRALVLKSKKWKNLKLLADSVEIPLKHYGQKNRKRR